MTSLLIPPETGAVVHAGEKVPLETGNLMMTFRCIAFALAVATILWAPTDTVAFPPAPHHLIYGTVKDQYGTPLMTDQAQVILVTPTGVQLMTTVVPGIGFEMNYQLEVPMDAGLTADPYEPNALVVGAAFSMVVVIGQTTNVPIQMTGNLSQLGQPGQQNRIDLTLGVDSNGNGIPDAWELAYLATIGSNTSLSNLTANTRSPNGLALWQEFLAGYYPFDPVDSLSLRLLGISGGSALLQFPAMTGRYYSLLGSSDLHSWVPLSFRVPSEGNGGPIHTYYYSPSIQSVQVQTVQSAPGSRPALGFTRAGGQITLSWPTNSSGFILVSAPSLNSTTWQPVSATPSIVGNNYMLTSAATGSGQFYRLSATPAFHYFRLVLQ